MTWLLLAVAAILLALHGWANATWAFRLGIEGGDIPLGACVSLFMAPILAVAAVFILRDVNKRGNEA